MEQLARGTTPTIKWALESIDPSTITKAYLTAFQDTQVIFTKDLSQAEIGDDNIAWTLAQEDTFLLKEGSIAVFIGNILTNNSMRVRSPEGKYRVIRSGYDEVM